MRGGLEILSLKITSEYSTHSDVIINGLPPLHVEGWGSGLW